MTCNFHWVCLFCTGKLVDDIRKRKGLPTDEKVVKDATKQRTVTRNLLSKVEEIAREKCCEHAVICSFQCPSSPLQYLTSLISKRELVEAIVPKAVDSQLS